jgi:hypothetical protein
MINKISAGKEATIPTDVFIAGAFSTIGHRRWHGRENVSEKTPTAQSGEVLLQPEVESA